MSQLKRLIQIAKIVRRDVESIKFYDKFTLLGGCGTASFHLMRCAKKNGISVRFVHGVYRHGYKKNPISSCHAWVEYDGKIIDLTVRQFEKDGPRILVIPIKDAHQYKNVLGGTKTSLIGEARDCIEDWAHYPEKLEKGLFEVA